MSAKDCRMCRHEDGEGSCLPHRVEMGHCGPFYPIERWQETVVEWDEDDMPVGDKHGDCPAWGPKRRQR